MQSTERHPGALAPATDAQFGGHRGLMARSPRERLTAPTLLMRARYLLVGLHLIRRSQGRPQKKGILLNE